MFDSSSEHIDGPCPLRLGFPNRRGAVSLLMSSLLVAVVVLMTASLFVWDSDAEVDSARSSDSWYAGELTGYDGRTFYFPKGTYIQFEYSGTVAEIDTDFMEYVETQPTATISGTLDELGYHYLTVTDDSGNDCALSFQCVESTLLIQSIEAVDIPYPAIVGAVYDLEFDVSPSNAIDRSLEFYMEDETNGCLAGSYDNVVSVEILGEGSVEVFARSVATPNIVYSVTLTGQVQPIVSLTVYGDHQVEVGETIDLECVVYPEIVSYPHIEWTVSDFGGSAEITSSSDRGCTIRGLSAGDIKVVATASQDPYTPTFQFDVEVQDPLRHYQLTFMLTGGTWSQETEYDFSNRAPTYDWDIPAAEPVKDGSEFDCWIGADGERYDPGEGITLQPGETILTAKWIEVIHTYVLFYENLDGAENVPKDETHVGTSEDEHRFNVTDKIPRREGQVFMGWCLSPSADRVDLVAGDPVYVEADGSKHLYAVWEAATSQYTVRFDLNGGTGSFHDIVVDAGEPIAEPSAVPVNGDRPFLGWAMDGILWNFATPVRGNIILTAMWGSPTADYCTVTFDGAGGTPGVSSRTVQVGDSLSLPSAERDGHTFDGWYDRSGELVGYEGDEFTPEGNITLIAHWVELPDGGADDVEPDDDSLTLAVAIVIALVVAVIVIAVALRI